MTHSNLDACYDAHGPVHGQVRRRRLMRALGAGRAPPLLARGEIPEPAALVTDGHVGAKLAQNPAVELRQCDRP